MAIFVTLQSGDQRQFDQSQVSIGSDDKCDVSLPGDGKEVFATVKKVGGKLLIESAVDGAISVNGSPVAKRAWLKPSDDVAFEQSALTLRVSDKPLADASSMNAEPIPTVASPASPSTHAGAIGGDPAPADGEQPNLPEAIDPPTPKSEEERLPPPIPKTPIARRETTPPPLPPRQVMESPEPTPPPVEERRTEPAVSAAANKAKAILQKGIDYAKSEEVKQTVQASKEKAMAAADVASKQIGDAAKRTKEFLESEKVQAAKAEAARRASKSLEQAKGWWSRSGRPFVLRVVSEVWISLRVFGTQCKRLAKFGYLYVQRFRTTRAFKAARLRLGEEALSNGIGDAATIEELRSLPDDAANSRHRTSLLLSLADGVLESGEVNRGDVQREAVDLRSRLGISDSELAQYRSELLPSTRSDAIRVTAVALCLMLFVSWSALLNRFDRAPIASPNVVSMSDKSSSFQENAQSMAQALWKCEYWVPKPGNVLTYESNFIFPLPGWVGGTYCQFRANGDIRSRDRTTKGDVVEGMREDEASHVCPWTAARLNGDVLELLCSVDDGVSRWEPILHVNASLGDSWTLADDKGRPTTYYFATPETNTDEKSILRLRLDTRGMKSTDICAWTFTFEKGKGITKFAEWRIDKDRWNTADWTNLLEKVHEVKEKGRGEYGERVVALGAAVVKVVVSKGVPVRGMTYLAHSESASKLSDVIADQFN